MPHQYSAENHDWDLTLRAAWSLLISGQAVEYLPTPGTEAEKRFACYLGSMHLSFSAIESFLASVAFSMPREQRFSDFNFDRYRKTRQFWDKLEMICAAIPYKMDKSQGLFQVIRTMQDWRNLVVHSRPYEIAKIEIKDTTNAPLKLHEPFHGQEYTRRVNLEHAKKFYLAAVDLTKLITEQTGIEPHASATFVIGKPSPDT
jgi:hypothetical protein